MESPFVIASEVTSLLVIGKSWICGINRFIKRPSVFSMFFAKQFFDDFLASLKAVAEPTFASLGSCMLGSLHSGFAFSSHSFCCPATLSRRLRCS